MNDKIEFKVNVKDQATSELRNIDNEFKKVDKSVNNLNININSIGNSFGKAGSILKGVLGAEILKNFAQLAAEASESNREFNRMISSVRFLSGEMNALKNVEIFENFKGKNLFEADDMYVAFKNARNSTLGFSEDILNIFGDVAKGIGVNMEEVSEIFTSNIEENVEGLKKVFGSVIQTSEGVLVQYLDSNNQIQQQLLKTNEDAINAAKNVYSGTIDNIKNNSKEQAEAIRQNFIKELGDGFDWLTDKFLDLMVEVKKGSELLYNDLGIDYFVENTEKQFNTLKNTLNNLFDNKEETKKINIELDTEIAQSNMILLNKLINDGIDEKEVKEVFKYLSENMDINAETLDKLRNKYSSINEVLTTTENKIEMQNQKFIEQKNTLQETNPLIQDYINKLNELKSIKDINKLEQEFSKESVSKFLKAEDLELLKKSSNEKIKLIQEEEKKILETQTNIYRLENLALEDNLNAKIELIKANTAKEIEERRKIGTLTNELEKEMLKRQEINIKKEIQNSNDKREREFKDLENKEKQKQKEIENELKLEKDKISRINKLRNEISLLEISNSNFKNNLDKEENLEKASLINRQRQELESDKITAEERILILQKHLVEAEILEKEHLKRREENELESSININKRKLENLENFKNQFVGLGEIGDFSQNFTSLFDTLDTDALAKKRELLLEEQKLMHEQEIEELMNRNAKIEEIELAKAEHTKKIADIEKQYTLGSMENISASLNGFSSILTSISNIVGNESKEMFRTQQAISIAQAMMNTYLAATKALAEGGPVAGPFLAGAITAIGLAQVATIASQKPKFHDGGYVHGTQLSNEVSATLQTGEGVLSRRGMANLDKLNRGENMTINNNSNNSNGNVYLDKELLIEQLLKNRTFNNRIKEIKG